MPRIAYVNGRYLPHAKAGIHVEDRGYQFADGVYEVCQIAGGTIIDITRHLDRLDRSLGELRMSWPIARRALEAVIAETARRNRVRDGMVYIQVTRGAAPRDHVFPPEGTRPSLVVTAKRIDPAKAEARAAAGVKVVTVPDNRWSRVDIKTVGLLPNVLARQQAREAGAGEAWFVDAQGMVTEGAATNAWIVTGDGRLVTRHADFSILRGVTRTTLLEAAARLGLTVEERAFSVDEAREAAEAFISGATTVVTPVIAIDGAPVGDGRPGRTALALRATFFDVAEKVPA
ncbi:MAG: D-amino-acid transaminase [Aquamicrobium sp.]|uniref:D-amino-acid transaminase n=1 Tax=Aquamicrobium sp. TaxID=1872579 RepID=UPI00349EDE17|nr:D-amino-acid transaminase [Aquamicrobium sp.]